MKKIGLNVLRYLSLAVIVASGCIAGAHKDARGQMNQPKNNKPGADQTKWKGTIDISQFRKIGDTVEIISTSDFLYHPLGKFTDLSEFKKSCKAFSDSVVTDSGAKIDFHVMKYKGNIMNVFKDDETKSVEIIYGKIETNDVVLLMNISVGISKNDFIKLFRMSSSENFGKASVIRLVSGLAGIKHEYYFDADNILTEIKMKSDYEIRFVDK